MTGPLNDAALEIFTKHISFLSGQTMVLDPESYGHEMYQHGGRYQWKIEGGRTADYQGVALKLSGDPEVYFIRNNRIDVVVRIHIERNGPEYSEMILANVANVLANTFGPVLDQLMAPYILPHEEKT